LGCIIRWKLLLLWTSLQKAKVNLKNSGKQNSADRLPTDQNSGIPHSESPSTEYRNGDSGLQKKWRAPNSGFSTWANGDSGLKGTVSPDF
jgi:hypothetical protein